MSLSSERVCISQHTHFFLLSTCFDWFLQYVVFIHWPDYMICCFVFMSFQFFDFWIYRRHLLTFFFQFQSQNINVELFWLHLWICSAFFFIKSRNKLVALCCLHFFLTNNINSRNINHIYVHTQINTYEYLQTHTMNNSVVCTTFQKTKTTAKSLCSIIFVVGAVTSKLSMSQTIVNLIETYEIWIKQIWYDGKYSTLRRERVKNTHTHKLIRQQRRWRQYEQKNTRRISVIDLNHVERYVCIQWMWKGKEKWYYMNETKRIKCPQTIFSVYAFIILHTQMCAVFDMRCFEWM